MPRIGGTQLAFPEFRGATRRLEIVNLVAFFVLYLGSLAAPAVGGQISALLSFIPSVFFHGALWQPFTYSFVHSVTIVGTLLELLSLWFLAGFLEPFHGDAWVTGLYAVSVLGTAVGAMLLYAGGAAMGHPIEQTPLYGCFGAIFGMLIAIG